MGKKIKPELAERIYNEFMKNVCVKARKVSKEGCRYDQECLMGKCICKYILKNYDVREKQTDLNRFRGFKIFVLTNYMVDISILMSYYYNINS